MRVNMHEAKTKLSQLVAHAEAGETVELMRAGKVVALVVARDQIQRRLGLHPEAAPGKNWDSKALNQSIAEEFGA